MLIIKKSWISLLTWCLSHPIAANADQTYMQRFQAYQQWSQNLPLIPNGKFLAFVDGKRALSRKLRGKWLYQLAHNKDWATYHQHYQPSTDINLQCYALLALYYQGQVQQAVKLATPLWLSGESQPLACNAFFNLLLKNNLLDEQLITQRVNLALKKGNLGLARYLLKQYKVPRIQAALLLTDIYLNPTHINTLQAGALNSSLYLFGLKRLLSISMRQAVLYWHQNKSRILLNEEQQQDFLTTIALYKAMHNQADASLWFAKVKPAFYTERLLDWQIRFALKNQQWQKVAYFVTRSPNKGEPCWQYWLARALQAQGQKEQAIQIYQKVAKTRNYYGFLASLRLNKNFNFEEEAPVTDPRLLLPYQPFLDQIKALYLAKQEGQAARLLDDFISELPKNEKSALIYWLDNQLQWHSRAIYLSSNTELNNQIALRFPLPYLPLVTQLAANYHLSAALIYAIIRQESTFRENVVSSAGAQGLMQIMPATAKAIAKKNHIDCSPSNQLFVAQKNINIGAAYLQELANRFSHHPVLMAAAYNAGPRQVIYWLKNYNSQPMDEWIETLPWYETRNYLKNIVAFYAVYQHRMHTTPDLSAFLKPF